MKDTGFERKTNIWSITYSFSSCKQDTTDNTVFL